MPEYPTSESRSLSGWLRNAVEHGDTAVAIGLGAIFLLLCLLVQRSTGAWDASFTAYPDEPSHFVSSVMIRDYLASGMRSSPLSFARNYYDHYPFFAVGYWPPFYYIVTALAFLVLGVGRFQALVVSAVVAAGSACLLFVLLRRRCGSVLACCAGFLYLSMPEVQHWFSTVMTDEMVVFFCLAAGICLLSYLHRPTFRNAVFCGVCCACATLTKYSGAYICVVPLASCILLRRFDLMKKPSFFALHATFVVLAGPWILLTMGGMSVGLPGVQSDPMPARIALSLRIIFHIFPLPLLVFVLLGMVLLALLPAARREDLVVIGLLGLGSISLLLVSPVDPEPRYFLGVAAALLALSFGGWAAARDRWTQHAANGATLFPALAVVLTIAFMATHLGVFPRPAENSIRPLVKAIASNPAWDGKRIVVASDLEGPMIAEFAIQDRHRPGYILLRPSKLFSEEDWFGNHYRSRYNSVKELAESFSGKNPADLLIWHARPSAGPKTHELLIDQMIGSGSPSWRKSAVPAIEGARSVWSVYEFVPGQLD